MAESKPTKTLADYLVIGVSPVLVMVLAHSLCFFLADVLFRETTGGVRWVLFWFVLAVVLIARIGIEQGPEFALAYGLGLAGATWLYLMVVQHTVVLGGILLGMVWFATYQTTCNCTLIDDEVDASGQGLMQRLRQGRAALPAAPAPVQTPPPRLAPKPRKIPKPQTPGVWLIYFSLAALPIFGVGQKLLPAEDFAARHRAVVYLFCYLAAALGLLMSTSFLGLRRYLRQRYLVMPGEIVWGWVGLGITVGAVMLCLTLLLPRPGAGEAWGALRHQIRYQLQRASEYATRSDAHGSGSGRAGQEPGGQTGTGEAPGKTPGAAQNGAKNGADARQSDPSSGGTSGEANGQAQGHASLPSAANALYVWLKWLFYLAVAVVLMGWLYRHRVAILAAWRSLLALIREFIARLRARKPVLNRTAPRRPGPPPFKTFKNPFLTGGDKVWPPERLIVYSYDALQSWAQELETPAAQPLTPREFCRQLREDMPDAAPALEHLAMLYGHVAYGASVPASYQPENLRTLWDRMGYPRPPRG